MRAWVNVQLLMGVPFVLPLATVVGAALGYLCGQLREGLRPRRQRPA
jgi:hypothetical protein